MKRKKLIALGLALTLSVGMIATGLETTWATEQIDAASEQIEGSPWNDTQIIGNLPEEKPSADEDFYTYCNYDYLEAHQDGQSLLIQSSSGNFTEKLVSFIFDENNQSELLDQIRILLEQSMDVDSQLENGFSDAQPYLDRISACESLDDLSALITSDDFPFDPFLTLYVGPHGMDGNNIVCINENFLFTNTLVYGGQLYHDYEITEDMNTWPVSLMQSANIVYYLMNILKGDQDSAYNSTINMLMFEESYGKLSSYNSMMQEIDYGTIGDYNSYFSMDQLEELAGNFPIKAILTKYNCEGSECFEVKCSDWLKTFASLYTEDNLEILKDIASENVLYVAKTALTYAFNDAVQKFQGLESPEYSDIEKIMYSFTLLSDAGVFGNQLGSIYLNDIISQDDLDRLTNMVINIRDSYSEMIQSCDWIDDTTRESILLKLDNLKLNILQPDIGYDDYSDLKLVSSEDGGTLFSNYLLIRDYNWQKQVARLGKQSDCGVAWYTFGASLLNCFYDPESNSINILPGYLSDATYNSDMTDAEMYGAIGTTVGHEISHGFDVGGSQYDANGLPNSIFSDNDEQEYLDKVQKLEDYFSTITVEDGLNVDGNFVSLEATADLCGIRSSLNALEDQNSQVDYTEFFESYSNMWSSTYLESTVQMYVQSDGHNQDYIRVNADCQMMDEFYDTYDVTEGDSMYLPEDERLTFWW